MGLCDPVFVGEDHGLDTVAELELHEYAFDVGSHRRFLDEERAGDLSIRHALREPAAVVLRRQGEHDVGERAPVRYPTDWCGVRPPTFQVTSNAITDAMKERGLRSL